MNVILHEMRHDDVPDQATVDDNDVGETDDQNSTGKAHWPTWSPRSEATIVSQLGVRCVIYHLFFSALRLLIRFRTLILSDVPTPLCSSNFAREHALMTQEVLSGTRRDG